MTAARPVDPQRHRRRCRAPPPAAPATTTPAARGFGICGQLRIASERDAISSPYCPSTDPGPLGVHDRGQEWWMSRKRRVGRTQKIIVGVSAAALVGGVAITMTGTSHASAACEGLAAALSRNEQFIAAQQADPDAQSEARIANRKAVIAQIGEQQKAAGCSEGGGDEAASPPADRRTTRIGGTFRIGGTARLGRSFGVGRAARSRRCGPVRRAGRPGAGPGAARRRSRLQGLDGDALRRGRRTGGLQR